MLIKEKVSGKERSVKKLIDQLRNSLNSKRQEFDKNPQNWIYLTTLTHTEKKLQELLEFFDENDN